MQNKEYEQFLANKAPKVPSTGIKARPMPQHVMDFQAHCIEFELRLGRAACLRDTGLGKTIDELEFSAQAEEATNKPSLILAPLAVTRQIEQEGHRFGYECRVVRSERDVKRGINICNYHRLDSLDLDRFGSVALDESAIIKSFTGEMAKRIISAFSGYRFRLAATATPAPNDYTELGAHSEFLGVMPMSEMLIRWFVHDSAETQLWRIKGHAHEAFWDWVASWAVMASSPEDLGYDGSEFVLPPFETYIHPTIGEIKPTRGGFFGAPVSATNMHARKRETIDQRARKAADVISGDKEPWIIWCDNNVEQDTLDNLFANSAISIRGSQTPDEKESLYARWMGGDRPILITKPSIFGYGMNMQRCHKMLFVGRSFSYETWYQAVRRCWRYGQKKIVQVHIITASGEDDIGTVLDRKSDAHSEMKLAMIAASRRANGVSSQIKVKYNPTHIGSWPAWLN